LAKKETNMTPSTLTAAEAKVLNLIALDEYQPTNGSRPDAFEETSDIWTFSLSMSWTGFGGKPRSLAGVVSSLVKKGLVRTYDGSNEIRFGTNQDPDTIAMTREGFAAWDAAFPKQSPATPGYDEKQTQMCENARELVVSLKALVDEMQTIGVGEDRMQDLLDALDSHAREIRTVTVKLVKNEVL
jgi:hypothetical protein